MQAKRAKQEYKCLNITITLETNLPQKKICAGITGLTAPRFSIDLKPE